MKIEPGKMYWGITGGVRHVTEISQTESSSTIYYIKVVVSPDPTVGCYREGKIHRERLDRFEQWAEGEYHEGDDLGTLRASSDDR